MRVANRPASGGTARRRDRRREGIAGALGAIAGLLAGPALAQLPQGESATLGMPQPWGLGLQPAAGPVKHAIHDLNTLVFWIIVVITVFVLALLLWCVIRFRASVNPTPSRTSHNTVLEIAWTVIPVLILVVIAVPSFRLIYYQDRAREVDLTINVQGRQWYWHYTYPDHGNFSFSSYPVPEDQLPADQKHLFRLAVDEPLVVPAGKNIRVLTVGQDVIHSFFVPSLGVQKYTIPGRTIETWFRADRPGTFYGQCNQICGTNHWFMPIVVRAVPEAEFQAWVGQARTRFAATAPAGGAPAEAAATTTTDTDAALRVAAAAVPPAEGATLTAELRR